jgi:hypothetical protein
MHSHQRPRGKILFEVLCALGLAASFASAWDEIGSPSFLASASITGLFAIYWSFGLFARRRTIDSPTFAAAVAEASGAVVEIAMPEEVLAFEPEVLIEPEPVAARPKKQRARKAPKAEAVVTQVIDQPEPVVFEEPVYNGLPLEPLFDPQPFVRQPRAFGRKERGRRPLPAG